MNRSTPLYSAHMPGLSHLTQALFISSNIEEYIQCFLIENSLDLLLIYKFIEEAQKVLKQSIEEELNLGKPQKEGSIIKRRGKAYIKLNC